MGPTIQPALSQNFALLPSQRETDPPPIMKGPAPCHCHDPPMTPQALLTHLDQGQLWPHPPSAAPGFDTAQAYQQALSVRALREQRGEQPRGFKIGFTNRTIWPLYQVFAPIWGTVWDTTLQVCEGQGRLSLDATCQPRLEPEVVFGLGRTPPKGADLAALFDSIDWIAPGFEVVQSHLPDWKFQASDTIADSGLHARLLVGRRVPLRAIAASANELDTLLAGMTMRLRQDQTEVASGSGRHVLDSPLRALHYFMQELRACPGAPDLAPGDVITTGTWTDAFPIASGQHWTADFPAPLSALHLTLD